MPNGLSDFLFNLVMIGKHAGKGQASVTKIGEGGDPASAPLARILIVEDEVFLALDIEATLEMAGYGIVGIEGRAPEAVARARRERPDLVLMDVKLALGDGVDAAIEIFETTGIRSFFLSAHIDGFTRRRAAPAQPLGWLPKPMQPEKLTAAVAAAIGQSHAS